MVNVTNIVERREARDRVAFVTSMISLEETSNS